MFSPKIWQVLVCSLTSSFMARKCTWLSFKVHGPFVYVLEIFWTKTFDYFCLYFPDCHFTSHQKCAQFVRLPCKSSPDGTPLDDPSQDLEGLGGVQEVAASGACGETPPDASNVCTLYLLEIKELQLMIQFLMEIQTFQCKSCLSLIVLNNSFCGNLLNTFSA